MNIRTAWFLQIKKIVKIRRFYFNPTYICINEKKVPHSKSNYGIDRFAGNIVPVIRRYGAPGKTIFRKALPS